MGWVKTEKTNKLSKLGDIDFTTTAPVDGNTLVYDEANDVWIPGNLQPVLYSGDEREIGVWVDGKPLYQKTINFGTLPNNDTKEVNHGISNIDHIWIFAGWAENAGNGYTNQLSLAHTSPSGQWYFGVNKTIIHCWTGGDRTAYSTCYVVVQYTKSTDTAGSGTWTPQGVPAVHYSTTERVVGTWIDDSPVYEKTQYISALPSSIGDWVNYPHGISNFDRLISVSGTAYNSDIPQQLNLPHIGTTSTQITISVSDTNIAFIVGQDRSSWKAYVTIRYTKSST